MKTVLVFGTFDPLHEGHKRFFQDARTLGDRLFVVVARDSSIVSQKGREPFLPEQERMSAVASDPRVDEAILGDSDPASYEILRTISFDILALGYDQEPDNEQVRGILADVQKESVEIVRLQPYMPDKYKSSLLRYT